MIPLGYYQQEVSFETADRSAYWRSSGATTNPTQ
jgi:hypothetical protein